MISTKYSGITAKQYDNLEKSFEKNREIYLQDKKSQRKEILHLIILISILPLMFLGFFIADIIINNKNFVEIVQKEFLNIMLICIGAFLCLFLMSWGLANSSKTKYNKKSLFQIFSDFISLSLSSKKIQNKNNNFYEGAYKGEILNGIPGDIKIDTYTIGDMQYESDNIFTQEFNGKSTHTIDNCYLGKITFPKKIVKAPMSIKQNSTNTLKGIGKRVGNSIYSALIIMGLYYIFVVEKCESKIMGNGCKNDIDLLGFFHPTYFLYLGILAVIIFSFGYIKTLYKKENIENSDIDNELDIFSNTDISYIESKEQEVLERIKKTIHENIHLGKNGSFYIHGNYLYIRLDKRGGVYNENPIKGFFLSIASGIGMNPAERTLSREYVNYVNFNLMLQRLGKELNNIH